MQIKETKVYKLSFPVSERKYDFDIPAEDERGAIEILQKDLTDILTTMRLNNPSSSK